MLPDWDFDGDNEKRRAFIGWVWAELDRFAALTTDRFIPSQPLPPDWLEVARAAAFAKRSVGAPAKSDAARAADGMDAAVWDYMLLKYMFRRYWPGRNRRMTDPANAARIAARRNWRELRNVLDHSDCDERERADELDKAHQIHAAWKRWDDIPGRSMAEADIAFLDTLPPYLFAG